MANYDTSIRVNTDIENGDLKKLQKDFDKLEAKLDALYKKGDKLEALGVDKQSKQWQSLRYDVAQTEIALEDTRERIREINNLKSGETENGFIKARNACKKFFASVKSGTKKSNGLLGTLSSRLKGIALSLLVFNWITKCFNAMVSAMKAGFQNLAQYSKDYNTAMSEMKSECAELKNNLAAAFEPVVTAVIPYITQMVSWLNTATESISKFLATISGKSTYTRAKKQVVDYAKSLESANDSAQGALAAFDDIDVLNKDENSGAGGELTGVDAFEEVSTGEVADWAQQFKDAIENGDWYGVGALLAEKLIESVSSISFDGIGKRIVEKVNDVVYFLQGFLRTFDFKSFGAKFAEIGNEITVALQNIDWAAVADTLSASLISVFDFASGFIENVDWAMLGETLYEALIEFIANIDWEGVSSSLFEFLGAALGGLGSFIGGIVTGAWEDIKKAWSEMVTWWYDIAYEDGEFIMEGLLLGIAEKIVSIDIWIREHIFKPFIDGFKEAFGIHSPSTVMQEMGGHIIDGLKNGLSGIWDKVSYIISDFKEKIKKAFSDIKSNTISAFTSMKDRVKNIFSGMWTSVKSVINSMIAGIEKMANSIISGINGMINALNNLSFDIPDWVPELGGRTFGLNISTIGEVSLPRLADGAVIQGGKPFAAILGDQKFGQTNIETPLDTMVDAFKQAISDMGVSNSTGPIYLQIDGKTFAKLATPYLQQENNRIGLSFKTT